MLSDSQSVAALQLQQQQHAPAQQAPALSNYAASVGRLSQNGSVAHSSPAGTDRSTPIHSPSVRKTSFGSETALQAADLFRALSRQEGMPAIPALTPASASIAPSAVSSMPMHSMGAAASDVYRMDEDASASTMTLTNGVLAPERGDGSVVFGGQNDDSLMANNNMQQYENGLDEFLRQV